MLNCFYYFETTYLKIRQEKFREKKYVRLNCFKYIFWTNFLETTTQEKI